METPSRSVAVATRSFAVCCCACLKMHYSQLLKRPFTSVTEVKEEREARALTSWVSIFARAMEIDVACVLLHCLSLFFHICLTVNLSLLNI